jgi:hypothetical protein
MGMARLSHSVLCCAVFTQHTCAYTLQERSVLGDRSPTPVMSSTNLRRTAKTTRNEVVGVCVQVYQAAEHARVLPSQTLLP